MNQGEVLTMMDVSDTICVAMPEEFRAVLLRVPKLAPVKVMVTTALAVIRECRGGGALPIRKESERPGEVPEFLSSRVLRTESLKLVKNRAETASQ
jgi:hypothetical protein